MTFKGKKHTEEWKEKQSKRAKGNKGNTGKKFTENHKRKISESNKKNNPNWEEKTKKVCLICNKEFEVFPSKKDAKFCSQQCCGIYNSKNSNGINNSFYSRHHTEETKKILCEKNSEENNPNFGRHFSEEHKRKISESLKNQVIPEEVKQKMKDNHANVSGKNNPRYGMLPPSKARHGKRSYYDSPLQGKICFRSSYELKFAQYLDEYDIPWLYEIQTFELGNITYTPDFYLPTCNLFIEIKGYMSKLSQKKINNFLDNYTEETLKILYKEDLIKLGIKLK